MLHKSVHFYRIVKKIKQGVGGLTGKRVSLLEERGDLVQLKDCSLAVFQVPGGTQRPRLCILSH